MGQGLAAVPMGLNETHRSRYRAIRMTRGKKTLLWVGAAILAVVAVYRFVYPDYSWRQKMTLELEVDGKPLTGSSVVEVMWENNYFNAKYATAPAWRQNLAGEATVVTLPGGQTIFALISSSDDLEYAGNIVGRIVFNRNGRVWGGEEFRKIRNQSGVLVIPPARYPLLVTFHRHQRSQNCEAGGSRRTCSDIRAGSFAQAHHTGDNG